MGVNVKIQYPKSSVGIGIHFMTKPTIVKILVVEFGRMHDRTTV